MLSTVFHLPGTRKREDEGLGTRRMTCRGFENTNVRDSEWGREIKAAE